MVWPIEIQFTTYAEPRRQKLRVTCYFYGIAPCERERVGRRN